MTLLNRASLSANRNRLFWSFEALSRILTKERISKALAIELSGKEESAQIPFYVEKVGPVYDDDADITKKGPFYRPPPGPKRYLRIFGILVMISMVEYLHDFIEGNIGDDNLPLIYPRKSFKDSGNSEEGRNEEAHDFLVDWTTSRLYHFDQMQWQFLTTFFNLKDRINHSNKTPIDYEFSQEIILPWIKAKRKTTRGAFSTIQRVTADPSSHEFHMVEVRC